MKMTSPNEFLQFAKEMGLGKIKSTSSSSPSPLISESLSNQDSYTSTGLSVLSNLCRLIEQIHQLKAENSRLRANLDLIEHVNQFQNHFQTKDNTKQVLSSILIHDRTRSDTIPLTKPTKIKRSLSNREYKGHRQDDSSSILTNNHESIDNNSSPSAVPTWNKVRHAFRFTLRRKPDLPMTPPLIHNNERPIPMISISLESDDDLLQDNRSSKKKSRSGTISSNENRQIIIGDETDQDDESISYIRMQQRTRFDEHETNNISNIDRQEILTSIHSSNIDDENSLTRKQSKIAQYRRKLRSKLDTVKRQFSEQNSNLNIRRSPNSSATTYDDIGSGLNRALLTAQLAPALTKSYQQKMREWETMQKSQFLVNYRRQSITPKSDPTNNNPSKFSHNERALDSNITSMPLDSSSNSMIDQYKLELQPKFSSITPILSPNQRTLIVHQWREIMSEEITLHHYNDYLEKKIILLKELETNLKNLKTNIFCSTSQLIKSQSMTNLNRQLPSSKQRCQSLESFIFIPVTWSLAVQSSAYSDVLDGTSNKTTERTLLFNKIFFDQLEQFKENRRKFQNDFYQDFKHINQSKLKPKTILSGKQLRARCVSTRACLRKLSLISSAEFPQYFLSDPILPVQMVTTRYQEVSHDEHAPITIISDQSISMKQNKRSRFDLVKSFQRSRSMYLTQFHSWLQRRRQHSPIQRRKSTTESKSSTPKLFGSPRLARLQQRFFKTSAPSSPSTQHTIIANQILDDTDPCSSPYELPVRIYFPPSSPSSPRHVRINEQSLVTSNIDQDDISSPNLDRKTTSLSSSFRMTTAKERRESFVTLSNIFNRRYV